MASSINYPELVQSVRKTFSHKIGDPDGLYRCITKGSYIPYGEWIKFYPKFTMGGFCFCYVTVNGLPRYDWLNPTHIETVRGYIKPISQQELNNGNK